VIQALKDSRFALQQAAQLTLVEQKGFLVAPQIQAAAH
jgi:hypothetical protein